MKQGPSKYFTLAQKLEKNPIWSGIRWWYIFLLERQHNATFHPFGILRHHWLSMSNFLFLWKQCTPCCLVTLHRRPHYNCYVNLGFANLCYAMFSGGKWWYIWNYCCKLQNAESQYLIFNGFYTLRSGFDNFIAGKKSDEWGRPHHIVVFLSAMLAMCICNSPPRHSRRTMIQTPLKIKSLKMALLVKIAFVNFDSYSIIF